MLNPFPIQFLALFAYFLLRMFVAGTLIYLGLSHKRHRHDMKHALRGGTLVVVSLLSILEIGIGLALFAGFYTQIAALATMGLSFCMIVLYRYIPSTFIPQRIFYILLFGTALSLFITGAGAFAFDLPI